MTISVLESTLASLSLWTMSVIDSMVPFLLGRVSVSCAARG